MTGELALTLSVNGERRETSVAPWTTLADLLRDRLRLTGTHVGCGEGVCGSCTVLIDDMPVRACLTLAMQADGRAIATIEGYAQDARTRAIQQAFVDHHAAQCGFCTSGMLAVVRAYLEDGSIADHGDEGTIRTALDAVICRCTGYQPIVAAVKALVRDRRG